MKLRSAHLAVPSPLSPLPSRHPLSRGAGEVGLDGRVCVPILISSDASSTSGSVVWDTPAHSETNHRAVRFIFRVRLHPSGKGGLASSGTSRFSTLQLAAPA
jgi:hypothetical protein